MYVELFMMFFIIGSVSFGGGYAILPIIETEVVAKGWFTTQEFTDIIAIAGMAPGPIATNSATVVGYHIAGIPGALISSAAMTLPSLIIIILISTIIVKLKNKKVLASAFYGLRPVVMGLITYAAIKFSAANGLLDFDLSFGSMSVIFIFIFSLVGLIKYQFHPAMMIVLSGILGIVFF